MPLTLGRTPDERKALRYAKVRWDNIQVLDWQPRSAATGNLLMEEGHIVVGSEELLAEIAESLEENIGRAEIVARELGLSATENAIVKTRLVLCDRYVQNLMRWREEARRVHRQWRFNETEDEVPELPKTGWQERDALECALWHMKSYTGVPPLGFTPEERAVTALVESVMGLPQGSVEESEPSDTESEDDFVITIDGEPMGGGVRMEDMFPGGDDEGRESSEEESSGTDSDGSTDTDPEMPPLAARSSSEESEEESEESEEEESEEEENVQYSSDSDNDEYTGHDDSDGNDTDESGAGELAAFLAQLREAEEESDDDDGLIEWTMPNRQAPPGEFTEGYYVPTGDA
jgi:hypothetical protein